MNCFVENIFLNIRLQPGGERSAGRKTVSNGFSFGWLASHALKCGVNRRFLTEHNK
jgi:hypothetical protein